jgi:hypothetical protein
MGMPWRPGSVALCGFAYCLMLGFTAGAAEPIEEGDIAGIVADLALKHAAKADTEVRSDPDGEPAPEAEEKLTLPAVAEAVPSDAPSPEPQEPLAFAPAPEHFLESPPATRCRTRGRPHQHCRCPDYCRYGNFDVLFLQRNVGTDGSVIAENASGTQPVPLLTNESMQPAIGAGMRLFYGVHGRNRVGWEIGYTGVYGMFGDAQEEAAGQIQIPGGLGQSVHGWATANAVRPTYASSLNMFEANLFQHRSCRAGGPGSPFPWDRVNDPYCHSVSWLFGLRWAGLNESADLNVQTNPGEPFTSYSVSTNSQLFGPQIGLKGRRQWDNWAVEGWAKTMLAGSFTSSTADPIFSSVSPASIIRPARATSDVDVGFVADLNYSLARRLGEHWWLRLGYNLIWVTGVALAPNQFDFTDTATSGTNLIGGSSVFLHGANLGLEARW